MSRALLAVSLLVIVAAAQAQYIPWDESLFVNGTQLTIPQCGGSVQDQCWEQTKGHDHVEITGYRVTSNKFPCTSGSTSTILDWNVKKEMEAGPCPSTCEGFGCSNGEVQLCGEDFGFSTCPIKAGTYTTTGKAGECKSGLGSYTITINCKHFSLATYLSF